MARQCNHCHQPIGDYDAFCPNCGGSNPVETVQQPVYNQEPVYQQPYQQPVYQQDGTYQQPMYHQPLYQQPETPMKWFKFVIWVQLFLSALGYLASALQSLTGAQYQGKADLVYLVFPKLHMADTVYGVLLIVLAVLAIVVRFRLSGYKKDGPAIYLGYLAAGIIVPIIYGVLASYAMAPNDATEIWTSFIRNFVGSVVMLVCNSIYFKKRKHLFIK